MSDDNNRDPAGAIESFRGALREGLKGDPTGDFGAEVAVAALDEILELVRRQEREACAQACEALQKPEEFGRYWVGRCAEEIRARGDQ